MEVTMFEPDDESGLGQVPPVSESQTLNMLDITGGIVEVEFDQSGTVVWVNVNGITRLRASRIVTLVVTDNRD